MSAKFTIEGSGQGAIDLIRKLNKELDGTEDQFDKAAKGAGRAEAAAKRLVDNVATPMERYKEKVDKLAQAVEAGYITQEKAKVAADRYYAILQKTDPKMVEAAKRQEQFKAAAEKSAQAQKKAAEETAKAAEANRQLGEKIKQSVETPMERYRRQLLEVGKLYRSGAIDQETFIRKARELKREITVSSDAFKEVEGAQNNAFGGRAVAQIAAYGAGIASVGSLISGLKKAFVELETQAQQSADRTMNVLGAAGELQQVSTSPEEYLANVAYARSLVRRGAVKSDEQALAFEIATDLAGADFTDTERELMARAMETGFVRSTGAMALGSSLRQMQVMFGGEEAVGDLGAVLDKVVMAGNIARGADPTETARAMTTVLPSAMPLGLSEDETWAALVTAGNAAKDITVGATQLGRFLASVEQEGLGGGSLEDILDRIGDRVQSGETEFDVLSDLNAVRGYRALSRHRGDFATALTRMGGAEGTFARQNQLFELDPILSSARERQTAENRVAMDMEAAHSTRENLLNAAAADIKANAGIHSGRAYNTYFGSGLADWLGLEDQWLRARVSEDDMARRHGSQILSDSVRSNVIAYLERQTLAAERTADATERMERRQPTTTRQE